MSFCRGVFRNKSSEPGQDRKGAALRSRRVARGPLRLFFIFLCLTLPLFSVDETEVAFSAIYEYGLWGKSGTGQGQSGGGSYLSSCAPYVKFLQDFIKEHNIQTIVDFGCGDWMFSQYIDWQNADYLGIDIVKSVIEENKTRFEDPHTHFWHVNGLKVDLPEADLFICKEVMQHLSNEAVAHLLSQLDKYKYAILVNDVDPSYENMDIPNGSYRPLDISKPPFSLSARKALTYRSGPFKKLVLIKN